MRTKVLQFPVFRPKGVAFCSVPLLAPLLGFLFDFSYLHVAEILTVTYVAILVAIFIDWKRTARNLQDSQFLLQGKSSFLSGISSEITFVGTLRGYPSPVELEAKLCVPTGLVSKDAIAYLRVLNSFTRPFELLPLERGRFTISTVFLRVSGLMDMWWWQSEVVLEQDFTFDVTPNHVASGALITSTSPSIIASSDLISRTQHGDREFDSLRPYNHGDNIKKIDWKRSARRSSPVVKTYRPESHQRIAVAIDCGRRMQPRIDGRQIIEYATDSAAKLIKLANKSDDEIGLFAFTNKVVMNLPCQKGTRQSQLLRTNLQSLSAYEVEPDYQLLANWIGKQSKRTLLILITNSTNAEQLDIIKQKLVKVSRRHLPVVFSIENEALTALTRKSASSTVDAFTISAAEQQLEEIKRASTLMKKSGLSFVSCRAPELPKHISRTYLDLKTRGSL